MRSADGLDLLAAIKRMDPAVPVIVMAAFADAASDRRRFPRCR
jgi:DNA-binding NtrC family response regulator